jgi:hypothetical protein
VLLYSKSSPVLSYPIPLTVSVKLIQAGAAKLQTTSALPITTAISALIAQPRRLALTIVLTLTLMLGIVT